MIGFMAHPKQAWEDLAETGNVLTDHLCALTEKGIVEFDILAWLARYRREMAKENFDCDEGEADGITAKILEATANELHRIGLEVVQSGIVPDGIAAIEISDEVQRELNERLLAVLDGGVDEIGILRWLALWRKQASMDDKRDQLRPFDLQLARVVHSAADNLENALDEWAESDPFDVPKTHPQEKILPIRREQKVGRNEPCPCGSGKKFKKCHGGI
jgi:hypothetical protein